MHVLVWSEYFMTIEHVFFKNGERKCSSYLKSEVNLDELDDNKVSLYLKPYEHNVKIASEHYSLDWEIDDKKFIDYFILDCQYDKAQDKIEIIVNNGFDVFIFNICALLGIGRLAIDEDVEPSGLFQAMEGFFNIPDRVKSIMLSLEEFKMLDGFVGEFNICNPSFDFLSLKIAINEISESVCDGAHVPDVKSDLLRGESLFIWD